MADNEKPQAKEGKIPIPPSATTTTKKTFKTPKTLAEKQEYKSTVDRARNKTRVNIGAAFERWRTLRDLKSFKSDAELATFLLDSYENEASDISSTPCKRKRTLPPPPPPPLSVISAETLSDRDDDFTVAHDVDETTLTRMDACECSVRVDEDINEDEFNDIRNSTVGWADKTWENKSWYPDKNTEDVFPKKEYETTEDESDVSDDSDCGHLPRLRVQTGGAIQMEQWLDTLPTIGIDETVHEAMDDDQPPKRVSPPPVEAKVHFVEDLIGQPASIVYHNSLRELAEYLVMPVPTCTSKDPVTQVDCGAPRPFQVKIHSRGTCAVVEWTCPKGHTVWRWNSQPTLKHGMRAGDFMLACNILLSGNNYGKTALLFKFMNMGMVRRSSFIKIQDSYCVDTIKEHWNEKKAAIISRLQSKDSVVALGDACMDSPGFSAQYCTYTAMENDSKEIISIVSVDKRETQKNSVVMEEEAFIQTIDGLLQEIPLKEFCTDAHTRISALFNPDQGKYKDSGVRHTLDIWQASKNLGKKILAAGQRKGCSILLGWHKDICNHFWYCCKMAETFEELTDRWTGLLHHVTGVHEWAYDCCDHGPLADTRDKEWIDCHSAAFQALSEVVLDEHLLKNMEMYLSFRSTAELESFHNHILMYASKRLSFSPTVYEARTLLAALDYNHHVHRPAQRKADGSLEYRKLYNKKSRTWRLYTIKVAKDYKYITEIQTAVLQARLSSDKGLPRKNNES